MEIIIHFHLHLDSVDLQDAITKLKALTDTEDQKTSNLQSAVQTAKE